MAESTASKTKYPFKADTVGSLLRPDNLKKAYSDFDKGNINLKDLEKIEDIETNHIVKKQTDLGLKAVTNGEFDRETFHLDFVQWLKGFKKVFTGKKYHFNNATSEQPSLKVVSRIAYNSDHPFFESFKYLKSVAPKGVTSKITIPSPTYLLFPGAYADALIGEKDVYPNRKDFFNDLITAYHKSILHFYDLGARYIQLDDPFWPYLIQSLKTYENDSKKHAWFINLGKQLIYLTKGIIKDLPSDLVTATHICRGNFQSSYLYNQKANGYDSIVKYLDQLPFDAFFLEYDSKRAGDFSPLAKLHKAQPQAVLVLGLVTSKFPKLEDKADLKKKIKEASRYVPLDHLALSPQCGFASTEQGNKLSEDQQWNKLKLVVDTAKEIWG